MLTIIVGLFLYYPASTVLKGTTSTAATFRLTSDGNAAGASNCGNLTVGQSENIDVRLVVQDVATKTNVYSATWVGHLYTQGTSASATLFDNLSSTASPSNYLVAPDFARYNGSWTGASATLAADVSNGCLDAEVTAPTGNSDKLDATMTVLGALAQ
jgi:hypothetical protein